MVSLGDQLPCNDIMPGRSSSQQSFPGAVAGPAVVPLALRLLWLVSGGQVWPRTAGAVKRTSSDGPRLNVAVNWRLVHLLFSREDFFSSEAPAFRGTVKFIAYQLAHRGCIVIDRPWCSGSER